jgi:hypothetical protein
MEIHTENIAAMRVILLIVSKAVSAMSEADFRREKLYQGTMYLLRYMLSEGLINNGEYKKAEQLMLEKYHPVLGELFSDLSLT